MKRFVSLTLILLLMTAALGACTGNPDASPTPSPTPTASPSAAPETSGITYSTDIPDVSAEVIDAALCSRRVLYEDADNIYFQSPWYADGLGIDRNGLYCFGKADGSIALIAEDVSCITLSDGDIYYASGEFGEYEVVYNTVSRYDTETSAVTAMFTHTQGIYGLAVFGGQFYYTADVTPDADDDFTTGLYRCAPDGSEETLIAEDAYSFCINENGIWYMPYGSGNGAPIFKCGLDGSSAAQVVEDASLYHFEVSGDMLIYTATTLMLRSLFSGVQTTLPDYDDFALLGQYIVLQGEALDAYDAAESKTYRLAELDQYWALGWTHLHTGSGCAYLSAEMDGGSFALYRIDIADGETSLTLVGQSEP